ncbi:sensor histidine kinase [Saccharothrix violaceirubra]|uniref:histidine kinase n=1 Tax=Saccharothrix violaceirubra TaxID=413306 RepID=A0A7W7WXN8_9PSEU|nr:sensor histidine kinase [Saccharothrix violaceirubra]MBB4967276.1 signal transduction histidine kinase [Saccharothrix violaceirubra]
MTAGDVRMPRSGVLSTVVREPLSRRAWLATMHLAVGAPLASITALALVVLGVVSAMLALTVVGSLACLAGLVATVDAATTVQRTRFAAFLEIGIQVARRDPPDGSSTRRLIARLREQLTWRRVGYHLLAGLLAPLSAAVVLGSWVAGVVLPLFAVVRLVDGDYERSTGPVGLGLLGLSLLFAAPWAALGLSALDVLLARTLLERSARDVLAEKVESLVESRAGLMEAADAERRRIERDLHDGAQQQLTSLAMNLGIARQTLPDLEEPVRSVIVSAHEDAKSALADLRNLVRGLHPAVLDERGLDAALAGVCARSPVPVRLRVDVDVRPSAGIEAIAYFVVSESLTNIAKHAQAKSVEVSVRTVGGRAVGGRLSVEVVDDGVGGAVERDGSGLRGLRQRVAAVDGALVVDSRPGRGTTIRAELPCV